MRKRTVESVRNYLTKCAQKRKTTTYSDVMERFNLTTREIRPIFQELVDEDRNHELVSLVRSKSTGKPGRGYFDSLTSIKAADYEKMTKKCFKRWEK